jgi:hypothetical protein
LGGLVLRGKIQKRRKGKDLDIVKIIIFRVIEIVFNHVE